MKWWAVRWRLWLRVALTFWAGVGVGFAEGDSENGVVNGSFEVPALVEGAGAAVEPRGWFFFTPKPGSWVALTKGLQQDGDQALAMNLPAEKGSFAGVGQRFAARPGYRYTCAVYVRNDRTNGLTSDASGYIGLEWYNKQGKGLRRDRGERWRFQLSALRWEPFVLTAVSPPDAAEGVVTLVCESPSGSPATCYFDNVILLRTPADGGK